MKVYTKHIKELLKLAMDKYEQENPKSARKNTSLADFFDGLTKAINDKEQTSLLPSTLYKQFYIQLEGYKLPEIGFAEKYLNALSQFVKNANYEDVYRDASLDETELPEFPLEHPSFPATPTIRVDFRLVKSINTDELKEYDNVWIKDESACPLGTFRDRYALYVYLCYSKYIAKKFDPSAKRVTIPSLSIVSSGNSAVSIQYLFRQNGLPPLRVLADRGIDEDTLRLMELSGCIVTLEDLKKLTDEKGEILPSLVKEKTDNEKGLDITQSLGAEFLNRKDSVYDWMGYEVLNQNPDNIFIAYGAGDIFKYIYNTWLSERNASLPSKRFFGDKNILSKCNYYGGYTENPKSKMKMLYASGFKYFSPGKKREIIKPAHVGSLSDAIPIKESFVVPALKLAEELHIGADASGAGGIALFLQMVEDKKLREQLHPKSKILIINNGKLKGELLEKIK